MTSVYDQTFIPTRLKIEVNYDQTFESEFGDDAYNVIRRVVAHANTMYSWSSLDTKLTLSVSDYYVVPHDHIQADGGWL